MRIKPEHSKNQVKKAGETLIKKESKMPEEEALIILNNWRSSHIYPLKVVQNSLRYRANLIDKTCIVTQRLKRISSIKNKLKRFPRMKLDTMQDIGGCRAILLSNELVYKIKEELLNTNNINIVREDDYIKNPKETGYRGIHLISQYCGSEKEFEGLRIEIQIRNKLQHYWATAVEIVDRFTNQQLKSGLENNDWNLFFRLMSDLIKDIEDNQEVINLEYAKQVKELEGNLKIRERLTNYSVIINWTENNEKKKGKFLLMLDNNKNSIGIRHFRNNELIEATNTYAELENQYKEENIDIVLVEANSIQELKRGYPNYFADSKSFVNLLSHFIAGV